MERLKWMPLKKKKKAYKLYKDLFWLHNASTDTEFKVNICEFI